MDFIVRCRWTPYPTQPHIIIYMFRFLWLIRQSSYSYVYWTHLDIFISLICWFIILINSYRHSRISVDSIPDLDLFTSPESSTSASTESDLGEDIESFVWRGLTFPVHWVYHIIMQIKALLCQCMFYEYTTIF